MGHSGLPSLVSDPVSQGVQVSLGSFGAPSIAKAPILPLAGGPEV